MCGYYIIGTDLTNQNHCCLVDTTEILNIDLWEPKSNYQVPRFHTTHQCIGVPLTIRECQTCFPEFVSFYHGTLVNVNAIEYLRETTLDFNIRFYDSEFTTILRQDDLALYKKYMYHFQLYPQNSPQSTSHSVFLVDIEQKKADFIPMHEIIFIDLWFAKKTTKFPDSLLRIRHTQFL